MAITAGLKTSFTSQRTFSCLTGQKKEATSSGIRQGFTKSVFTKGPIIQSRTLPSDDSPPGVPACGWQAISIVTIPAIHMYRRQIYHFTEPPVFIEYQKFIFMRLQGWVIQPLTVS